MHFNFIINHFHIIILSKKKDKLILNFRYNVSWKTTSIKNVKSDEPDNNECCSIIIPIPIEVEGIIFQKIGNLFLENFTFIPLLRTNNL